jgi:hypothetical protein
MFRLVAAVAVLAFAAACTEARPSPAAPAPVSASPSPTRSLDDQAQLLAFAGAIEAALRRVRPGAALEPAEMSVLGLGSSRAHQLRGLLTLDGRTGVVNAVLHTVAPDLTCDDFQDCVISTGACGSTVRVVRFERPVDRERPRDIEYRAAARWRTGTVEVSADNSATWWENGSEVHTQTGEQPPLTAEQLREIVTDPATNVLSPAC